MAGRRSGSSGRQSRAQAGRAASFAVAGVDPGKRIIFIVIIFAAVALVLAGRVAWLSVIDGPANAEKAQSSRTVPITLPARRGTIYDRNGAVLATSVNATTIYCNPNEVTDPEGESAQLAAVLGGKPGDYIEALTAPDTSFSYIARKADEKDGLALQGLNMDGVYFLADSKRVYPNGRVAGQVVGVCNVDDEGQSGLEGYYDELLSGTDGSLEVERGANGYPIAGGTYTTTAALNGSDIVVSLDLEMQEYLEDRLEQAVQEIEGKEGSALIYDGKTGEIIAMASTPYLNPSDRSDIKEGALDLKPVSLAFEPGSIFKTVSATAILEEGVLTPSDTLYCPAQLPADEYVITDAHERTDEVFSLRQILAQSSNVGISLATEQLGFDKLYHAIERYGFTTATGADFPGESAGYCADVSEWSKVQSYNVSFGQGISVTPLQVARFYGALTNDGVACTPHFLQSDTESGEPKQYPSTQIIENTGAIEPVTSMLQSVVSEGTGTAAQIEGFKPAGKTGTAEFVDEEGQYSEQEYNISFVGYLPDTDSSLVCFVGVTQVPGDRTVTPAFRDIMAFAINHYGISPSQG